MLGRALLAIPVVLVCASVPGFIVVGRLRWSPLEKVAGSIALSLTLLFVASFAVYAARAPRAAYAVVLGLSGVLAAVVAPDWLRVLRAPRVRETLLPFAALVTWTIAMLALVRHYSGGDWCCDWVEHYQRSVFFLERWSRDFRFIGQYLITQRPPLMNVVTGSFLGLFGTDYPIYQIVFTLLNLLVFFPCCLFARRFSPRTRGLPWLVAIFLGANPMFFMNTTFPWTKVLAAFFVMLGTWFFIRGWRKRDDARLGVAFLCLSAGTLVHYSSGPYAVILAGLYVPMVWLGHRHKVRAALSAFAPAVGLGAIWIGWAIGAFGLRSTFAGNVTVEHAAAMTAGENLQRIASNMFHTFWPYIFPGSPDDTPLRRLTDRAFTFYQENFLGAIGSVAACVVLWLLIQAWRNRALSLNERRFWAIFIPLAIVIGIAVDSEVTLSGFANICLQPLVYLAVTLVAARFCSMGTAARALVGLGLVADFVLGVVLEVHMESQMQPWARSPNWDLKQDYHLTLLGDALRRVAPLTEGAVLIAAGCAVVYLARLAPRPATSRR